MAFRNRSQLLSATGLAIALVLAVPGCGGGGGGGHVERPVVRWFSPNLSPIDFSTQSLQQNPTQTDGSLLTNAAETSLAQYEWRDNVTGLKVPANSPGSTKYGPFGRFAIYFQDGTVIDPQSVLSNDPSDPLDHAALLVTKYEPGTGNSILPIAEIEFTATRILLKPAQFAKEGIGNVPDVLPNGQYTIRLSSNVTNTDGDPLFPAPVFHTVTVGAGGDTTPPTIVNTSPGDLQTNVGAGVAPPPPPGGVSADDLADVRTTIFGPTSPDIVIEFNEPIRATSVSENNIQVITGGPLGGPLGVAPGYPKLKSEVDGDTLPSNGHEVMWRADASLGGLPFQSSVQVTVVGSDGGANGSPIEDLSGNDLEVSKIFTFFTVAPPDVPQNPFPEYSIWWSALDRVGALDIVNQQDIATQFTTIAGGGLNPFPQGIRRNVVPQYTDTITNNQNIPGFSPTEITFDQRTTAALCHSYVYVMSAESSQVVIVNTRTSLPVALINTPSPGGLAGQFSPDGANILAVSNTSANTITFFDMSNINPGTAFLNGPIFIQRVLPSGNTPTAITMSESAGALTVADWNRDGGLIAGGGPIVPLVLWVERTEGALVTYNLGSDTPSKRIFLGANAAPTDVVMTPCFGLNPILFAAISQAGGGPGEGKVSYYVAGPGCTTGTQTAARPDDLVGNLAGFDGPSGMDETFSPSLGTVFFVVAESGGQANRVTTLGVETGAANLPRRLNTFTAVGANPTSVCHRAAWLNPCVGPAFDGFPDCFHDATPSCHYNGTEQDAVTLQLIDQSETTAQRLYICASGAAQISVVNMVNGSRDVYSPISIKGLRRVAAPASQ